MRKIAAGLVFAIVMSAAACGASNQTAGEATATVGALNGKTAVQVLSASTAAVQKAGSAHYVLTAKQGSQTQTISGDAATDEASQSVSEGSQHIQVVYVGGIAYVEGNAAGLESAMGLTAAVSATYASKWIAVHSADSPYSAIVKAVMLETTVAQLVPTGQLKFTDLTTIGGRQAIGVRGGLPAGTQSGVTGTTTLYVATGKPTLPLEFQGQANMGAQHVVDIGIFTRWGQTLHLSAPTGAVAYATVSAAK